LPRTARSIELTYFIETLEHLLIITVSFRESPDWRTIVSNPTRRPFGLLSHLTSCGVLASLVARLMIVIYCCFFLFTTVATTSIKWSPCVIPPEYSWRRWARAVSLCFPL
jgi:hypothetical protein